MNFTTANVNILQPMGMGFDNEKFKTELCVKYRELGACPYGSRCRFAHGEAELRTKPKPRQYKTKPCNNFMKNGSCPYGVRCNFLHSSLVNDLMALNQFNAAQNTQTITNVSNANAIQQLLQNANALNSYQQNALLTNYSSNALNPPSSNPLSNGISNVAMNTMNMNSMNNMGFGDVSNIAQMNMNTNQMNTLSNSTINGLFNMKNINSYYSERPQISERIQEWKEMRGEGDLNAHVQIMKDHNNEQFKQKNANALGDTDSAQANALYSQQLQQLSKYSFPPINAVLEALSKQQSLTDNNMQAQLLAQQMHGNPSSPEIRKKEHQSNDRESDSYHGRKHSHREREYDRYSSRYDSDDRRRRRRDHYRSGRRDRRYSDYGRYHTRGRDRRREGKEIRKYSPLSESLSRSRSRTRSHSSDNYRKNERSRYRRERERNRNRERGNKHLEKDKERDIKVDVEGKKDSNENVINAVENVNNVVENVEIIPMTEIND